jgi:hypothetical protein
MVTKKSPNKQTFKFTCDACDYKCSRNSEYIKHLLTRKHIGNISGNKKISEISEISKFACQCCNKVYKSRKGLWGHKQKCKAPAPLPTAPMSHTLFNKVDSSTVDNNSLTMLVVELIKSNTDLQKQVLEVCKNSNSHNNNNNNNNHSHNKTFNMQFFLNEQCKDAMNIMDFVDTIKLEFSDLERVGEVGYVEGMSNIIIQKLNEMDIYKRPIHCSDAKRETMFVKDKNIWEKETGNHDKLRLAIRYITKKNTDMVLPWCYSHPGSCDSDNYLNDVYLQIVQQAMGAGDIEENETKIMKKIAKMVLIDKNTF